VFDQVELVDADDLTAIVDPAGALSIERGDELEGLVQEPASGSGPVRPTAPGGMC